MKNSTSYILGVFNNQDPMVSAVNELKSKGVKIADIFSPYPIHGIDDKAGFRKTRMYGLSVIFGIISLMLTYYCLYWCSVISYPLHYGGKPLNSVPSFLVICFVMTINLTSFASLVVFLVRGKLLPGKKIVDIYSGAVDDKFVIAIDKNEMAVDEERLNEVFNNNGAVSITERIF